MLIPIWLLIVGGIFAVIGLITVIVHIPDIFEGIADCINFD